MFKSLKKKFTKRDGKTATDKNNSENISYASAALRGLGVALLITCIVFILCALIITYTDVSEAYVGIISTICTAVSGLAAGLVWSKAFKKKGLITGAFAGAIYGLIILLIGVLSGGGPLYLGTLTCLLVAAAGGGIGGVFGVNQA